MVVRGVFLSVSSMWAPRASLDLLILIALRPNNPLEAKWLSGREKMIVIQRKASDNTGVESKVFKNEQILEALFDLKTWLLFFAIVALQVSDSACTLGEPSS